MATHRGIYRRGQIWWITYQGLDGRQKFESSRSTLKSDAQYILACRRKEIAEGKDPIIKRIDNYTFFQLTEKYRNFVKVQRSYRSKNSNVRLLEREFGDILLRRFNPMIIEQYQSKRGDEGKKPATANRAIATLKHMFTKAVEWEMIEDEVLKKIRRVKLLQESNRRLRYLSQEDCQALINSCAGHLRPIVIAALYTGMRKGEILSLEWERHVDLKHGFILLDITKNGERREIPISQPVREVFGGLVRYLNTPYVFTDGEGKRLKDVKRSFRSACRRASIKDFRFHDLRHCFASHLVMAGIDLTTVKELLGHKTLTMTLRYAHLAPSHKIKAMDILAGKIGNIHDNYMTLGVKKVGIQ